MNSDQNPWIGENHSEESRKIMSTRWNKFISEGNTTQYDKHVLTGVEQIG